MLKTIFMRSEPMSAILVKIPPQIRRAEAPRDSPMAKPMNAAPAVLSVEDLRVELRSGDAIVEDVTLSVAPGQILGLVGESGSGKTTTALALLGYARPGVRTAHGEVVVAGERVGGRDEQAARRLRGRLVSYVPQDPGNALGPALR
jgi:peptide/nickel transport system ATP-binding protein